MEKIKEVIVEFLRNGPAHNQLLSPLTDYIVLCGDHDAITANVPFEHRQLLHHLSFLRYISQKDEIREFELNEMGRKISDLLENIPGLIASLADKSHSNVLPVHLRLMISSSELALLPFELANTPSGVPGKGEPLLLQSQRPVCMTRRVRRVTNCGDYWRDNPKILFIAAAPADMSVPVKAHLLALRRAISPWVRMGMRQFKQQEIERSLMFLPNASLASIEKICREHCFTHVHILAHGGKIEGEHEHYGLILHNSYDVYKPEIVTGRQLATALQPYKKIAEHGMAGPTLVSIASCDSGNIGTVIEAGASVAHQLHEGGIPMVIASQFPLSKPGSIIFVETFYERILWGTDPRLVLTDLRRQLYTHLKHNHDWASIVVYDGFPSDMTIHSLKINIEQANHSIKVALDSLDRILAQILADKKKHKKYDISDLNMPLLKLQKGTGNLQKYVDLIDESDDCYLEAIGMLASAKKRYAQVLFSLTQLSVDDKSTVDQEGKATVTNKQKEQSYALMREAMELYELVFKKNLSSHWAITQYLSLFSVLSSLKQEKNGLTVDCPHDIGQLISAASIAAEIDLNHKNPLYVAWAHSTLTELEILNSVLNIEEIHQIKNKQEIAKEHLKSLLKMGNTVRPAIYSNIMQLNRYLEWYEVIGNEKFQKGVSKFSSIIEDLPNPNYYAWKNFELA